MKGVSGKVGPHCPICGGSTVLKMDDPPPVALCRRCDLLFLAEASSFGERESFYQEEYYQEETGSRFLFFLEYLTVFFRWLRVRVVLRWERGPASLLDVGCGRGIFLELLNRRGWKVMGTQLSKTAAAAAKKHRGLDVAVGELTSLGLPRSSFKVITFIHVLEHLSRPVDDLRKAHELLEDSGLLFVEVPNHAGFAFRLLGRRHFCFDYPNHRIYFTPRSLRRLLEGCGFRVVRRSFFSLEYSPFTTLQNMLNFLPGTPNRFYRALMLNREGQRLRREPLTAVHLILALVLAPLAFVVSLVGIALPTGNTMGFVCRKEDPA